MLMRALHLSLILSSSFYKYQNLITHNPHTTHLREWRVLSIANSMLSAYFFLMFSNRSLMIFSCASEESWMRGCDTWLVTRDLYASKRHICRMECGSQRISNRSYCQAIPRLQYLDTHVLGESGVAPLYLAYSGWPPLSSIAKPVATTTTTRTTEGKKDFIFLKRQIWSER